MKDKDDKMEVPDFKAEIPDELMDRWADLDPVMKVVLKQQSITSQQTGFICQRLVAGEDRMTTIEGLVEEREQELEPEINFVRTWRLRLAGWRGAAMALIGGVLLPLLVVLIKEWMSKW